MTNLVQKLLNTVHNARKEYNYLAFPISLLFFTIVFGFLSYKYCIDVKPRGFYSTADVTVYNYETWGFFNAGKWAYNGIVFVYPPFAFVLMLVPAFFVKLCGVIPEDTNQAYAVFWLALVIVLYLAVVIFLPKLKNIKNAYKAILLFCIMVLSTGIVGGLSRTDSVMIPFFIFGLLFLLCGFNYRETNDLYMYLAGMLLCLGTLVKITPVAGFIVGAVVLFANKKITQLIKLIAGFCLTGAIVFASFLICKIPIDQLFSFMKTQESRGLQLEAVFASPINFFHILKNHQTAIYNEEILTAEVPHKQIANILSSSLNIILVVAICAIIVIIFIKAKKNLMHAFTFGSFCLTISMIVFNKVGSPQFVVWLVPPCMLMVCAYGFRNLRVNLLCGISIIAMIITNIYYPEYYSSLYYSVFSLGSNLLFIRNFLYVVLLILSFVFLCLEQTNKVKNKDISKYE